MRRSSPCLFLLLPTAWLVLLAGCGQPKPWQGAKAADVARLEEHRALGLAQLENKGWDASIAEFQAIQKAQPALAFGYVNEAVAQYKKQPVDSKEALIAARKGVELAPKLAWPHVVLAQILSYSQRDEATKELELAAQLEPDNLRVLGVLAKHLKNLPQEPAERTYELQKRMAELAPDNFIAQTRWMEAQVKRQEWEAALVTLDKVIALVPHLPKPVVEHLPKLRKALQTKSPQARVLAPQLYNVLQELNKFGVNEPLWSRSLYPIAGNENDPADWAMRAWDVPPPALAGPALPPITITWKDVTSEAGVGEVLARGVSPVATGDWKLAPDAGEAGPNGPQKVLAHPDLAIGGSPLGLIFGSATGFTNKVREVPAEASPLLVDLNNDFSLDLFAASPQGDVVWRNPKSGTPDLQKATAPGQKDSAVILFKEGSLPQPVRLPSRGPGSATAVDVDQDGDLDLLRASSLAGEPAVRWLRNNGNLSFTDMTLNSGLVTPTQGARQVVFADFDRDGDPDLFVVQADGPSQLILNQRQDRFKNGTKAWAVKPEAGALSAAVADYNRDGTWDLAVVGRAPHGSLIYQVRDGKFVAEPLAGLESSGPEWVQWLDYDNDSWLDLVVAGQGGVQLFHNENGKLASAEKALAEPARWVKAFDYDQDGDLDLAAVTRDNKLRLLRNEGGNARPWLDLELQGLVNRKEKGTNSYAIGSHLETLTAWDRQLLLVSEPQTHLGLGRAERLVGVRITFTDGVPLNLIGPDPKSTAHYVQTTTESCPFLYVWDGEKFRFATDFNWRSPLGMQFTRGVPIPHNQTGDWVRVPGEWVKPDAEGKLQLIATEELREVSYFDQIRLMAVDHPAESEVYADERFSLGPQPAFALHTAMDRRLPVSATDETGADLLPTLRSVDNSYTPLPDGNHRGIVAPHDLILDLGAVKDPANVKLFLNGWIWPANTSTYINAGQNPATRIIPPTLYVGDGHGGWTEADRGVGLPCGKRKTMVLDLSNRFVGKDFRVKLTTTMEIRWDALFFTSGEASAPVRRTEASLLTADLRERGYGTLYQEAPEGPFLFDYQQPLPPGEPGWPNIEGRYTRLGECRELLGRVDDRFVIMGPGDEIRLSFDGKKLPPLPTGWKRDYIVLTDGWTKDSDPNTVLGEQVGPLPFHGMKRYPYGPEEHFPNSPTHQQWQQEWNTRVKKRWDPQP